MASGNGSGGMRLLGVALGALIVAVFVYFLIGYRLGPREPSSTADVRIQGAMLPVALPEPEPKQRK